MAEVKMDLAELEQLKEALKFANSKIDEKDLIIKGKDEEIVQVKADKRTLKTTIREKKPFNYDLSRNIKIVEYANAAVQYFSLQMRGRNNSEYHYIDRSTTGIYSSSEKAYDYLYNLFAKIINESDKSNLIQIEEKTEYINFDDVLVQIRNEAEKKVSNEILKLKTSLNDLQNQLNNAEIDKQNSIKTIKDTCDNIYNEYFKKSNDDYNELFTKFNDLKNDKETLTLQEQISKLQDSLAKEKAKKWYQKIFN